MRDRAASSVVGAIVVLAVLGTSIVYVNTVYVPRQGASLEVAATERVERALFQLAASLSAEPRTAQLVDIPLRTDRPAPPLMSGIVLTPAQTGGLVAYEPDGINLTVSILTDVPPGGVPAGDPIREDAGNGRMRVYLVGNETAAHTLGTLRTRVGGAYLTTLDYRLEAGALLLRREGSSSAVSAPSLSVLQSGSTTSVSWVIPIFAGPATEVSSTTGAQVGLTPGPMAELSGSKVHNVTIRVQTATGHAWRSALSQVVGSAGYVNASIGADDRGFVTADIAPPAGASPGTRSVDVRFFAVRYEVGLAQRTASG